MRILLSADAGLTAVATSSEKGRKGTETVIRRVRLRQTPLSDRATATAGPSTVGEC